MLLLLHWLEWNDVSFTKNKNSHNCLSYYVNERSVGGFVWNNFESIKADNEVKMTWIQSLIQRLFPTQDMVSNIPFLL